MEQQKREHYEPVLTARPFYQFLMIGDTLSSKLTHLLFFWPCDILTLEKHHKDQSGSQSDV